MTAEESETRKRLLAAFRQEGIIYPDARLDDAVEDFSHLLAFTQIIRKELSDPAVQSDD